MITKKFCSRKRRIYYFLIKVAVINFYREFWLLMIHTSCLHVTAFSILSIWQHNCPPPQQKREHFFPRKFSPDPIIFFASLAMSDIHTEKRSTKTFIPIWRFCWYSINPWSHTMLCNLVSQEPDLEINFLILKVFVRPLNKPSTFISR